MGGCQGRRDQDRGSRRTGDGRSLGPLPRPARASARDPAQGTLAVREGLFDSFGEQLRPARHKWGYHQGPSRAPRYYPALPLGLSLHICAVGAPGSGQSRSGVSASQAAVLLTHVCDLGAALGSEDPARSETSLVPARWS